MSDGASDVTDQRSPIRSSERSPIPKSRCDMLWTRALVMLANRSPMRGWQCSIRLLACVAVLAALLC